MNDISSPYLCNNIWVCLTSICSPVHCRHVYHSRLPSGRASGQRGQLDADPPQGYSLYTPSAGRQTLPVECQDSPQRRTRSVHGCDPVSCPNCSKQDVCEQCESSTRLIYKGVSVNIVNRVFQCWTEESVWMLWVCSKLTLCEHCES